MLLARDVALVGVNAELAVPVGSTGAAIRCTCFSVCIRYWMMSATEMILRPCWRANRFRSGTRAIVPSSFMISQITAAGSSPAMGARSMEASVWPARLSTPPSAARSGNMWPGRARSCGRVFGSMATRTVSARSAAEMPVVTRPRASIETVNAVPKLVVLSSTISGSSSSRTAPRSARDRSGPGRTGP